MILNPLFIINDIISISQCYMITFLSTERKSQQDNDLTSKDINIGSVISIMSSM